VPYIDLNGTSLHYEINGEGPETIVFSHGLLMSGAMFRSQVEALQRDYRCVCYDHRGQGLSEVTEHGYDMDTLTGDAAELIRRLGAEPCHFVGLSMGGFVGLRLALEQPRLLRSLILLDTSADPEPEERRGPYRRMAWVARWLGLRLVVGRVMHILFGRSFLADPAMHDERIRWRNHLLSLDRRGTYRAAHGVIDRAGVYERLGFIDTPTLILVGDEDIGTVPAKSERMQAAIAGARLEIIPRAGHSSSIEQPERVTKAIRDFLASC